MNKEKKFLRKDGSSSIKCEEYYYQIKNFAQAKKLQNTLKALELAIDLHDGKFRDGGEPYIIHPMEVTVYLILLNLHNAIYDLNMSLLNDKSLVTKAVYEQLDELLSSSLLHDTREDCRPKFLLPKYKDRIHEISSNIWKHVNVLTKDKEDPEFSDDNYFSGITHWIEIFIKVSDRISNYSTIYVFETNRMEKYVREVYNYFYPLIRFGKNTYPDFSRCLSIMKNFLVSITETVAALQGMSDIIKEPYLEKTINFIRGFAVGKSMPNTLKALVCAQEIYAGHQRKSEDEFIIHPLRVCSYLISLKINDDEICAAALVHEAIKKCELRDNAIELVTKWHLNPAIRDYVMIMASNRHYSLELFYALLKETPKVFLLKLANRVNTCTTLLDLPNEEIRDYIDECEKFIYPTAELVIKENPEYEYAIRLMTFHIRSECDVTKNLKKI